MQIDTHKHFDNSWEKLSLKQQKQALRVIELFKDGAYLERMRIHQLKGKYYPQYSISVGGDLRIHYLQDDSDRIVLMLIGTHSQLY